jgi:hypothetical protein
MIRPPQSRLEVSLRRSSGHMSNSPSPPDDQVHYATARQFVTVLRAVEARRPISSTSP